MKKNINFDEKIAKLQSFVNSKEKEYEVLVERHKQNNEVFWSEEGRALDDADRGLLKREMDITEQLLQTMLDRIGNAKEDIKKLDFLKKKAAEANATIASNMQANNPAK